MGAMGAVGPHEETDHPALGLEIIEQKRHPLEILECLEIVEQVSSAAHDELALVRFPAGPARESYCVDLLSKLVQSSLCHPARFLELNLAFRPPAPPPPTPPPILTLRHTTRRPPTPTAA